jgi:hypothetical protein
MARDSMQVQSVPDGGQQGVLVRRGAEISVSIALDDIHDGANLVKPWKTVGIKHSACPR